MKLILALLISLPILAAQEHTIKKMTFKDALRASYNTQKNQAARDEVKAVHEQYVQARSGFLPKVKASTSYAKARNDNDTYHHRNNRQQGDIFMSESKQMGVTLDQNIFNGGSTLAKMSSADAKIKATWEKLEKTEQESYKEAADIYLDLIMQQRMIQITEGNLKFVKKAYEDADQKHKAGEETITNVEAAKAEFFKGEANHETSMNDLDSKKSDFLYKTTIQAPNELEVPEIEKMLPKTLEAAYGISENHYAIRSAQSSIDQAQATVDDASGTLMPKVDFQAGLNRTIQPTNQNKESTTSDNTAANFMVQASMPIYEGGEVRSKIREAAKSKSQAQLSLDSLRKQIRTNVTQAWINMNNLKNTVVAYKKVVEASQLAVNSLVEEQKAGSKTLLDVLEQQRKLFENQRQLVDAETKYLKSCFGLLGAIGTLNDKGLCLNVDKPFDKKADYEETKRMF